MANVTVTKAGKSKSVPERFVPTFLLLGWTQQGQQMPRVATQAPSNLDDLPIGQLRAMTEGLEVEGDRRVKANLLHALRGQYQTRVMRPEDDPPVQQKEPATEAPPIEEPPVEQPDEQPQEEQPA